MPLYPFILLGAMFLAIIILPPLVAAYLDYRRESGREGGATGRAGPREEPGRSDENSG